MGQRFGDEATPEKVGRQRFGYENLANKVMTSPATAPVQRCCDIAHGDTSGPSSPAVFCVSY